MELNSPQLYRLQYYDIWFINCTTVSSMSQKPTLIIFNLNPIILLISPNVHFIESTGKELFHANGQGLDGGKHEHDQNKS